MQFVQEFVKLIATYPDKIEVFVENSSNEFVEITIQADRCDVGKIIGKDGKMINSIKTLISGCKAKENKSYRLSVKSYDE